MKRLLDRTRLGKIIVAVAVFTAMTPVGTSVEAQGSEPEFIGALAFGSTETDISTGITTDDAGNIYLSGNFRGTGDFDGNPSTTTDQATTLNDTLDFFVASYDPDLNYRWSITAGGAAEAESTAIARDDMGNIYVSGTFDGTIDFDGNPSTTADQATSLSAFPDLFVASYDSTGNYRWSIATGWTSTEIADAIAVDGDGNVYITGRFIGLSDFDATTLTTADQRTSVGKQDIFIASYDNMGDFRWSSSVGGPNDEFVGGIAAHANNVVVSGSFDTSIDLDGDPSTVADQRTANGSSDIFIVSYDASGTYRWSTSTGGSDADWPSAIASDDVGNTYIVGPFSGTGDFDGDLNTTTDQRVSNGQSDIFITSYDDAGMYRWSSTAGGTELDFVAAIAVDGDGNSMITGDFDGTIDFDGNLSTTADQRTTNGVSDVFIASYDATGSYRWSTTTGSASREYGSGIAVGARDATVVAGQFAGIGDFDGDPSTDADQRASNGSDDVFIAQFRGMSASTEICNGLAVTIDMNLGATGFGTAGDDVIFGTPGSDVIDGMGGDDTICGEGGDDNITGSAGVDFIYGGDGNDTLNGGDGNDRIRGQQGIDDISGGPGNDFLYGGIEGDTINGDDGRDTIGGFGGADTLNGGPGNDKIFGGFGADTITGGDGNDTIRGLVGNDTINGGPGDDDLNGDNGLDTINGSAGNDTIRGGNSVDTLFGDDGNDSVNGGKSDDALSGGNGNDTCTGNTGTDTTDSTCETVFGVP